MKIHILRVKNLIVKITIKGISPDQVENQAAKTLKKLSFRIINRYLGITGRAIIINNLTWTISDSNIIKMKMKTIINRNQTLPTSALTSQLVRFKPNN